MSEENSRTNPEGFGLGAPPEVLMTPSTPSEDEIVTAYSKKGTPEQAEATTGSELQDFLWKTHEYLNEYIRFSDMKAGFIVAISGAVLGALSAANAHELFIQAEHLSALSWTSLLSFVFLVGSLLFAIWSVRPRLWSRQPRGYIFWGGITEYDNQEMFFAAIRQQSSAALTEHLGHHVYALSEVCKSKFLLVSVSIVAGTVGGLLGALVLLLKPFD